jgi:DNA repair exonuclease SbcCD ATPase subunit
MCLVQYAHLFHKNLASLIIKAMQDIVNRKERANARWRFAGLYILSLAFPILLFFNVTGMGKVECKENEQLVEQLRKRDRALAELSQLAGLLNNVHELKPAYAHEPQDQARYDQLHYNFERGVDQLKRLYYSDTALYKHNYNLVAFLEHNQKEYDRLSEEFHTKVEEEIIKRQGANAGQRVGTIGGGDNPGVVVLLQLKLQKAQNEILDLKAKLAAAAKDDSSQLADLRNRSQMIDANIEQINTVLAEIEQDCNGIQRKSDKNTLIKNQVLVRVKFLKNHVAGIANTNRNLSGMIPMANE